MATRLAGAAFYLIVATLFYAALAIITFLLSVVMLSRGIIYSSGLLHQYQAIYYGSSMHIWQSDPLCAAFDSELIYVPRIGSCEHNTAEFNTSLTFDEHGRVGATRNHATGTGIAVIGDSYAMGWGVNDDETFSSLLESMLSRPVYNLAVSSYATERELKRLEKSGLLSAIDTVIIQYCRNDLMENSQGIEHALSWRAPTPARTTRELFDSMYAPVSTYRRLYLWMQTAVEVPIWSAIGVIQEHLPKSNTASDQDFTSHYEALHRVLVKFPWLEGKRVIVFYADHPSFGFSNFESFNTRSRVEFVDISLDARYHFKLDWHLNSAGHRRTAEELRPIVLKDREIHSSE